MTESEKQFFDMLLVSIEKAMYDKDLDTLEGLFRHGAKAAQELKEQKAELKSRLHSERVKVGIAAAKKRKELADDANA